MLPLLRLTLLALPLLLVASHPRHHPEAPFTRDGMLFVGREPLIPTGVYFWPDVSAPSGRSPFEDVASYGLDLLVAWYEYVRPDRTVANQPDVHTLRAECERFGIHYFVGAATPPASTCRSTAARVARAADPDPS